jgi:uncharacterized protein (DUF2147 family)
MLPILMATLLAAAPSADTAIGTWHSPTKNGLIQISKCGASICGTLLNGDDIRANPDARDSNNSDPKLKNRPLKGLQIFSGFTRGDGDWENGQVYDPSKGKTYSGKITIKDANTLSLRGCIFVPLCRTDTWTRAR